MVACLYWSLSCGPAANLLLLFVFGLTAEVDGDKEVALYFHFWDTKHGLQCFDENVSGVWANVDKHDEQKSLWYQSLSKCNYIVLL